ncbi:MAG: DUF1697 domain-containing protein [Phycisphaerales bacterium]|nr:DUF1697 domain-containing protein [Phycisphaerales bacterium]
MPTAIALIRGINVGGKNILPMASLRVLCERIGFEDVRTHIQSGNVVFRVGTREVAAAAARLEQIIEADRGFRPRVVVRSIEEWARAIEANPFAARRGVEPGRMLIMFLDGKPTPAAARSLAGVKRVSEELELIGREVHLYFPDGVGKSKLSLAAVEKALGAAGTARNWNTIVKLREMAEQLGA